MTLDWTFFDLAERSKREDLNITTVLVKGKISWNTGDDLHFIPKKKSIYKYSKQITKIVITVLLNTVCGNHFSFMYLCVLFFLFVKICNYTVSIWDESSFTFEFTRCHWGTALLTPPFHEFAVISFTSGMPWPCITSMFVLWITGKSLTLWLIICTTAVKSMLHLLQKSVIHFS